VQTTLVSYGTQCAVTTISCNSGGGKSPNNPLMHIKHTNLICIHAASCRKPPCHGHGHGHGHRICTLVTHPCMLAMPPRMESIQRISSWWKPSCKVLRFMFRVDKAQSKNPDSDSDSDSDVAYRYGFSTSLQVTKPTFVFFNVIFESSPILLTHFSLW
jgi:hypothetical protein